MPEQPKGHFLDMPGTNIEPLIKAHIVGLVLDLEKNLATLSKENRERVELAITRALDVWERGVQWSASESTDGAKKSVVCTAVAFNFGKQLGEIISRCWLDCRDSKESRATLAWMIKETRDTVHAGHLPDRNTLARRRWAVAEPKLAELGWTVYRWEKEAKVASKVAQRYLDGKKNLSKESREKLSAALGIKLPL